MITILSARWSRALPSSLLPSADSADCSGFFASDWIADWTGHPSLQGHKGHYSCPFPSLSPFHPLVIIPAHVVRQTDEAQGLLCPFPPAQQVGVESPLMHCLLLPCRIAVLFSCFEIPVHIYTSTYTRIRTFVCVYLCSLRV